MNPLDKKSILSFINKQYPDTPKEDIVKMIDMYYRNVRKKLSSAESLHVDVTGLGVFHIIPMKVERAIDSMKRVIEKSKSNTMLKYETMQFKLGRLKKLEYLMGMVNKEEIAKIDHRIIRENYKNKK